MWIMLLIAVSFGFLAIQFSGIAVTVYLHRCLTHEAFKMKRPADLFFRLICWFMIGTLPRGWVGVHRKHHAFTDVEGDPHSPILEGFWQIQLFGIWYIDRAAKTIDLKHWARGVPEYGWLDRHYMLGLLVSLVLTLAVFGGLGLWLGVGFYWGVLFGLIAAATYIVIGVIGSSSINGLCHVWGYKTFKEADAYNVRIVALLTMGEGLHNNHHKHQRSPCLRTGERWGEVDFGWWVIKFLDRIGQIEKKSEAWPA